jgi:hypothetical protein
MPVDQTLTASVRNALVGVGSVEEIRMFGGIGFMLQGNLLVGASTRGLLVRIGKDRYNKALGRDGARSVELRGRTLAGYVYVDPPALTEEAVREWVWLAVKFVRTLPVKAAKKDKRTAKQQ